MYVATKTFSSSTQYVMQVFATYAQETGCIPKKVRVRASLWRLITVVSLATCVGEI
jgi:hypothetical protein